MRRLIVLCVLLAGCAPITGPTIRGPGELRLVEVGPLFQDLGRGEYRYHVMDGDKSLTWGGLVRFTRMEPFTWSEFQLWQPALSARLEAANAHD